MQLDPVKILLVDDVEENLTALDALLRRDGLEILKARSGVEALELLLIHDFALALLDVQMPGMDGFELAELMRGTERTCGVPIIFLTAMATDERRSFRGYEAGAVDYLFKPVEPQVVRNKVAVFVELCRQRQELAHQRDDLSAALGRLKAHSDNSPLAIIEFDGERRVLSWSKGAERLFGWRAAEVAGFRPDEFEWIWADDSVSFARLIDEMIAGRMPRAMQALKMRTAEGAVLECECYCSALLDGAGQALSINLQVLDVTDRKRAEETQRLLVGELNHRVKNTLASVQAIATQTLRYSTGPSDFAPTFIGRIHALARAHSILSNTTWQGASLRELIEGQLHTGTIDEGRLVAKGPDLELAPEPALHLALVFHELTTNANKYGALSVPDGSVHLSWQVSNGQVQLDWAESGGPATSAPSRKGFGTALIERSLKAEGGSAEPQYGENGMGWTLRLPIQTAVRSRTGQRWNRPPPGESGQARERSRDAVGGKRFLVIEDEPVVALELVSILEDAGARVFGPVANVEDARAAIAAEEIDAVLLDGNLQGEMSDEIANLLAARHVPFLFVSGYDREHLSGACGDVAIVTKPFDAASLIEAAGSMFLQLQT
ncbi:response regulator [Sphingomonas sp.]|uniref:response regulator n=1 Tax=Sphingomonas sp. TaxID=28214 RepID=UPI002BE84CB5|nr:response regulator [Sphingomonas sp.]HWK36290.1 response regulator [Sphingomonas sp.]